MERNDPRRTHRASAQKEKSEFDHDESRGHVFSKIPVNPRGRSMFETMVKRSDQEKGDENLKKCDKARDIISGHIAKLIELELGF